MFNFLYETSGNEKTCFGDHWCGQEELPHWQEVLVAKYSKDKDSDGQSVEVYCCATPARFYTLAVASDPNSIGEHQEGYRITTGSSCHELAAKLAEAISSGMLGFNR